MLETPSRLIRPMNRTPGLPSGCQPAWLKRYCRVLTGLAYGGHDVKGIENVPLSGPVIVAARHRSYLDPILMSAFLPRPLYFMGKRELFRVPLLGTVIRSFGALPIDRRGGSTFRAALGILKLGGALVIFAPGESPIPSARTASRRESGASPA